MYDSYSLQHSVMLAFDTAFSVKCMLIPINIHNNKGSAVRCDSYSSLASPAPKQATTEVSMAAKISRLDLTEAGSTISVWLYDTSELLMRVTQNGEAIGVPFSTEQLSQRSKEIMMGWLGRCGSAGAKALDDLALGQSLDGDRGAA